MLSLLLGFQLAYCTVHYYAQLPSCPVPLDADVARQEVNVQDPPQQRSRPNGLLRAARRRSLLDLVVARFSIWFVMISLSMSLKMEFNYSFWMAIRRRQRISVHLVQHAVWSIFFAQAVWLGDP